MRLDSLTIRGFGPFREQVHLDLNDLGDATLVAVCGDNGEGKSSLLELAIPGALYRSMPTQGSLRDRATARDSLLEVVISAPDRYTIRHLVDGVSGKGESVVLDSAGKPVSGSTKVSEFDSWAARTLPPVEVLLASTFGAQQDRGFLGASPSERKAILLRTLGIARYEAWATEAARRASACKQQREVTRARVADARRTGGDVAGLTRALAAAQVEARQADDLLTAARTELTDLEERARAARDAAATASAHATKASELRARIQALESKRQDIETRIAACQRTLGQEKAIRDAAAQREGLQRQLEELGQQRSALSARGEAAQERARSERELTERARQGLARITGRIGEIQALLARGAEITQAEADLLEIEQGLTALRDELREAQARVDELTAATVASAEDRVGALRTGLVEIRDGSFAQAGGNANQMARRTLEADDLAVQQASERPAQLQAARKAVEATRSLIAGAEQRQRERSALARRAGELRPARAQLAGLETEREQLAAALKAHESAARKAAAEQDGLAQQLAQLVDRQAALQAQAQRLGALADQLPHIALAASKLEERKAQRLEVAGELEAATWALSELGPPPAPVAVPDVAPARAKVAELERAARAAHQAAAVASSKLDGARQIAQQIEALEQQQRAEETELADWTRLSEDLGRKGLQAAEIDSCGPELTALVNDLLHNAHGPRWTVRIDTQKLSADGKKTLEGCQVTVIDTVKGREDEGSKFSGGERVIIGEAMALGLSMLACQRSGLRGVTLVRDETGAALDPVNAEVYVRMLRRAARQIGAERLLFVSHNREVSDLADARITVAGGRLLIDAQAGRVAA